MPCTPMFPRWRAQHALRGLRAERADGQVIRADEGVGLGPGEDAGRGPDGTDAARPDGAGELQAIELGLAFEQARDVTGDEGVAAAGAVDVIDRIDPQPDPV